MELPEKRTATSSTFLQPDGSFQAEVYSAPIHYRDDHGAWRRIDNTLVPTDRPGYEAENEANDYRLLVPADAGERPVRVSADGDWISFDPAGADGSPVVDGSTATITGLASQTRVEYQATAAGVKETIVLDAAPAVGTQPRYVFHLDASAGITPELTGDGGLRYVDAAGETVFVSPAPFMVDSSDTTGEPTYSTAVTYDLAADGTGWTLTVTPDSDWLADPARVYPVQIDPTVTQKPADTDCWLSQDDPTTPYCGSASDYIRVGTSGAGGKRRGLLDFVMPSTIPVNATVTDANLSLYLVPAESRTSNNGDYVVRRVTRSWTGAATWNTYNGTNAWSSAGGDFLGEAGGETSLNGTSGGYKTWDVTAHAAGWVNGSIPNYGLIVKAAGLENVNNSLGFWSSDSADSTKHPKLTISYTAAAAEVYDKVGERRFFDYEEQALNDRMTAKVNVANGNLLLTGTDVQVKGTGLDASVQRYYNSLSTSTDDPSKLSAGWVLGDAPTVRLEFPRSGRVTFVGPSGYKVQFDKTTGGDYQRAEPGLDADLSYDSATSTYRLHWHSKTTYVFNTSGRMVRQEDKQGNQITYTYDANNLLDYLTDTRGRRIDFTYTTGAAPLLDSITDVAGGRTYKYTYAQFAGDPTYRLASSAVTSYSLDTDNVNLNKTTQYAYDAAGRLTTVTDPRGNLTRFTYDGTTRKISTLTRVTSDTTAPDSTTTFTYQATPTTDCDSGATKSTKVDGPRTDVSDVTTYCLDSDDRVVQVIDAKGHKRSKSYTSNSNVATFNESGVTGGASYSYGYSGDNLTSVTLPTTPGVTSPGQASAEYQDTSNPHFPTSVRDFANDKNSAAATWSYDYDNKGNLIEAKNTTKNITYRYCYDGKGMLQRIDAPPVTVPLDEDTNAGCGTANQDNDSLLSYDTDGQLTSVDEPGPNRDRTFTYDATSRVKTVTDGRGVVTTYRYDALDHTTEATFTDPTGAVTGTGKISYTYDTNGNLTARADATGNTNYSYDDLNRMLTEAPEAPSSNTSYTYDTAGNLTSIDVSDEPAPVTYTYDNLNRTTTVVDQKGRTTSFGYDKHDQRERTTYPNGVVMRNEYDDARRLRCTYAYTGTAPATSGSFDCPTASTSLLTFFSYDYTSPLGLDTTTRHTETNRDNHTTSYTYDTIDRLEQAITKNTAGTTLRSYAYTNGMRSNITKETVTGTTVPNTTTTFDYNLAGELCWTASGSYTTDSCATTPAGATTYNYDKAGNLAGASSGLTADYNLQSQTSSITPPGGQAIAMEYADVTSDRRTKAGDTRMGYNLLGLSAQGPNNGVPHTDWFVRDPHGTLVVQADRSDTSRDVFYLFDGLGSVAATTDQNGAVINRYTYEPYGEQINPNASDTNPWRYASGYYDKPTGMLKFGTRYYTPNLARWTQPDPVTGKPNNPPTLNPYAYVGCNPVNSTDLSGRDWWDDTLSDIVGSDEFEFTTYLASCAVAASFVATEYGVYIAATSGPEGAALAVAGACVVGMFSQYLVGENLIKDPQS